MSQRTYAQTEPADQRFVAAARIAAALQSYDREDVRRIIAAALIMLGNAPSATALADLAEDGA